MIKTGWRAELSKTDGVMNLQTMSERKSCAERRRREGVEGAHRRLLGSASGRRSGCFASHARCAASFHRPSTMSFLVSVAGSCKQQKGSNFNTTVAPDSTLTLYFTGNDQFYNKVCTVLRYSYTSTSTCTRIVLYSVFHIYFHIV